MSDDDYRWRDFARDDLRKVEGGGSAIMGLVWVIGLLFFGGLFVIRACGSA